MRPLALHTRGRRAGPIACGLVGVAATCWALAAFARDPGMLVAVLGPLCAVSLLGFALGGDDPALERTMPQRWPRWRATELAICALVAGAALLPTLLRADQDAAAALRNLAGLSGLTALGATALGPRLAWLAPTAWGLAGAAVGPHSEEWLLPLLWPIQPGGTAGALVPAAALAIAGAYLYTRRGSPPASYANP